MNEPKPHPSTTQVPSPAEMVLDDLEDSVALYERDGTIVYVNRVTERLFGKERDALIGRRLWSLFPHAKGSLFGTQFQRVCQTGEGTTFENLYEPRNLWFENSVRLSGNRISVVGRDITARKRLEAERDENHSDLVRLGRFAEDERIRLRVLLSQVPAVVNYLRGPELVFEFVHPQAVKLFGRREVLGKPLSEALPEFRDQEFPTLLRRVVETGESIATVERPVLQLDPQGHTRQTFWNASYLPVRDGEGTVAGVMTFDLDVTEQVRARQGVEVLAGKLRESEQRLRLVMEASGTGTWEVNLSTREVVADAPFRELFGLTLEEPFTLDKGLSIIHPEDSPRVARAVSDAIAGKDGGEYAAEYRTVHGASGTMRWVDARGRAQFGVDGKAARFWGTGVDITLRKETETAQARLLDALSDQPLLYVALFRGPELRFAAANDRYRQVVGGRDVVGKTLHEALPELDGQGFDALLTKVFQTGEPFIGREMHTRLERRGRGVEDAYFNFVYQAVRGSRGSNEGVLVVGHDVTDEVLARREALRAAKERGEFEQQLIGIVSHDLRTPVQSVLLGTAALLRREVLDEKAVKAVLRIQSSAERMSRMVKDLLDFTLVRLGEGIQLWRKPVNLHALVRSVIEEVRSSYPGRDVRLEEHGDPEGSWDADRLAQVVQNLISNALQYSPQGSAVTVRTRSQHGEVTLEVHNPGAPIPPEALGRLFKPLQRGSSHGYKVGRSVGLGLYIVKHLVDAHGGTIQVRSMADTGTTFTVTLPRALGRPPAEADLLVTPEHAASRTEADPSSQAVDRAG